MHLRNVLLALSVILMGFCVSLYFQTGQTGEAINWDQYSSITSLEERSYSIEDLNEKIIPYDIEELVAEIWEKNRLAGEKTRIMEIGFGNGRLLMSLKKKFPEIEFYGINREKTHDFYRRESYITAAINFDLMSRAEIQQMDLPYVVFQDLDFGQNIPYAEDKFDLIYSIDFMRSIKYKFEFFNEIMRVLKPGGLSFHTDVSGLTIYSKGLVIDLKEAINEMKKRGFDVGVLDNPRTIRFRKAQENQIFPFSPHQPIPEKIDNLPEDLRRSEMGYNLTY